MDKAFYDSIFPQNGLRVLAVFKNGLKSPPTHQFFDDTDDFIAAAGTFDSLGKNVYHACASYQTDQSRKGDNVTAVRSLWVDLDVGPTKAYPDQRSAVAAIEKFRMDAQLDESHVVSSGNGIHIYYPLEKAISADQWVKMAALFAACLNHAGVKHDSSRTEDRASVLRIPGTKNYKTTPPKDVKILRRAPGAESAATIFTKLQAYADANNVLVLTAAQPAPGVTNDLIGAKTHPPSEGAIVSTHCPVIAEVELTGGDVSYDIWWRAIGLAKHTTDSVAISAVWTANRAANHSKHDYQKVLDEWTTGPTTCKEFSKHSSKCAGCQHNGKITSPIQLGVSAVPVVQVPVSKAPTLLSMTGSSMPGPWGFAEQWILDAESKAMGIGYSNGSMTQSTQKEDGTYEHRPFCNRYWQVMRRIKSPEHVWQLEIGYEQYPGQPPNYFMLDSAAVLAPDVLKKEFSARELHIFGGNKAMFKAQEKIMYEQQLNYTHRRETATYRTMGWMTADGSMRGDLSGEFVIGDTIIKPQEAKAKIMLADNIDTQLREGPFCKGTTEKWVELINFIYDRPGAEGYQFLIASAFAAPLVRLVPGDGEWHGIPIVVSGVSSAAKTTTSLVAMSLYGPGQKTKFSANMTKHGQGDTINALSLKLGALRNLPCVFDEMSEVDAEKIGAIMHMTANGKMKDRMGPNGQMISNPYRWDTITHINANESLHEVLKGLRSQHSQEATQLRSFEIWFDKPASEVFPNVNKTLVEDNLLGEQFGCAGRDWLQFVVNNREKITEMLSEMRRSYQLEDTDTSAIRFYKDLLVTVSVASRLAKAKGYINWNINAMMKWAESQLLSLRDKVAAKDWDGVISDFVASFHGRTIVTKTIKLGPGRRLKELPLEPLSTSVIPVARNAIDDKVFIITANAVRDWCQESKIMPSRLVQEMAERGYLKANDDGKFEPRLINIGSGTMITRPQAPCYELDYEKVVNFCSSDYTSGVVQAGNVVPLIQPDAVTMAPCPPPVEQQAGAAD